MKLMLDCRAMAKWISQTHDVKPPLAIRAGMRLHLLTCQGCRNVDEQMRFVRTAIQAPNVDASGHMPAPKPPE